jgi:hypothetical protein
MAAATATAAASTMEMKMEVHRDDDKVLGGELHHPTIEDANRDSLPPPKD